MDLNNLQIGQKLYSALNGEVTFLGYIEDPEGNKVLLCTEKNNSFSYYFTDGKFDIDGLVVLFTDPIIDHFTTSSSEHKTKEDCIIDIKEKKLTVKEIEYLLDGYDVICSDEKIQVENNHQVAELLWKKL